MRTFIVYLLILITASLSWAVIPDRFSEDHKDLFIAADYACFKYSDNIDVDFTEIYYSFFRNQLFFQPDSVGYYAFVDVYVIIISETVGLIDSSSWRMANSAANLSDIRAPNYLINDIVTAQLEPGDYDITIIVADVNSEIWGRKKLEINVPLFSVDELQMSQLELVYNVLEPDSGHFDKAGKKIIPNTRGVFSHDDNVVYFYTEAYNLDPEWNTYTFNIRVYDGNGNIYKNIPPVTQPISANSAVILNGFNITSFNAGMYKLEVSVHTGGNSASTEKYFEVTPGKLAWELAREREELADFPEAEKITTDEEAKNFKNQILFIASREELKQYNELPLNGKTRFAEVFWSRRDPTPGTAINEYKLGHYERVRYANENFSMFKIPGANQNGWRTDRGRVYIVYGEPSDEENYPSALEARPWIKWNYDNVEGGVYFIFIDETGYGNYRLVHSSAQGEPKDYNWEERLEPSTILRNR